MVRARELLARLYRRTAAGIFYLFRIFPIQENKVVVNSCAGRKYGDNAQYILEELHRRRPDLDLVWLKDPKYDYQVPSFLRTVPVRHSLRREFEMATAKVWIGTHFFTWFDRKRPRQFVIQTWHGGMGIKKTGLDHEVDSEYRGTVENNGRLMDLAISNCRHLEGVYRNGMGYRGEILRCGYPRNDLFFSDVSEKRRKVLDTLGLSDGDRLLLYAPTYRGHGRDKDYGVDFDRLRQAFAKRFGGNWTVLMRYHPSLLAKGVSRASFGEGVYNVTRYPDMQELICAADAFLSDYSTSLFDAALRRIPCFTFAVDLEEYQRFPGIYYEMDSLPFAFSQTMEELEMAVAAYDQEVSDQDWHAFCADQGLVETGHAAKDVAERILMEMRHK